MKLRIVRSFVLIVLILIECGGLMSCNVSAPSSASGIPKDVADSFKADYAVSVSGREGTYQTPIGSNGAYTVTITNVGLLPDTYTLTTTTRLGWADFQALPDEVTLAPDEQASFPVSVTIPLTASLGMEEEITIGALSHAFGNMLADQAITRLEVVP